MSGPVHSHWRQRERYRRLILLSILLGLLIGAAPTIAVALRLGFNAVTNDDLIGSGALGLAAAAILWLGAELVARIHLRRGWRLGE